MLFEAALETDILLVQQVLQCNYLIALVLQLLDELLLTNFLLEHGTLIELNEALEVRVSVVRLLGQLQQVNVLTLLDLNAALGVLDLSLDVQQVDTWDDLRVLRLHSLDLCSLARQHRLQFKNSLLRLLFELPDLQFVLLADLSDLVLVVDHDLVLVRALEIEVSHLALDVRVNVVD